MKKIILVLFVMSFFTYGKTFKSSDRKIELIELYTSESCSSCPPAEKWLNSLKKSSKIWVDFIPLEFHVDYWNNLNWIDAFSKPEFSQRQRQYNQILKAGVYTPQVIIDGNDWRLWRRNRSPLTDNKKAPVLTLKYTDNKANLKLKINNPTHEYQCFVAITAGELKTKVKSGENRGKNLSHEFVVINLKNKKLSNNGSCDLIINKNLKANNYNITAWIYNETTQRIIQATGGPL